MQPLVKHERTETKECVGLEQNSNEVAAVLSENARNEIAMNWSRSFVAQYFKKRPTICCACRKSNPDILVVQPAENGATENLPGPFDGTRDWRILLQG